MKMCVKILLQKNVIIQYYHIDGVPKYLVANMTNIPKGTFSLSLAKILLILAACSLYSN